MDENTTTDDETDLDLSVPDELRSIPNPCAEIKLPDWSKFGKVKKKPYQDWVWKNIDGIKIPLDKMGRSHVQNCLNWCIRRGGNPAQTWKDGHGHTYQEWITAFTVRLFDPECK